MSTTPKKHRTTNVSSIGSPYVFPKSEDSWQTEFFQHHASAAMKRSMMYQETRFVERLYRNISRTDSPLEAAFVACLMALPEWIEYQSILWRCQHEVEVDGRGYRLDLVFEPNAYSGQFVELAGPHSPKIALELDGHEFHEKTKEQVTYRNRRDRDLQSAGWIVLHVSGSEFHRNPEKVTQEIYDRVSGLMIEHLVRNRKTA